MAATSPLSEPQIQTLVLDLQTRFAWRDRASSFVLERTWRSRTANLALLAGHPSGPRVVVKLLDDGDAAAAEGVDRAQRHLRDAFVARTPVAVAEPLGWSADPAATCAAWAEGDDLIRMLADLEHPAWAATGAEPARLVAACGRALGDLHLLEHARVHEGPDDLAIAARAMLVGPERLRAAGRPAAVPSFGDFGPHQFIVGPEGSLTLIDPPPVPVLAPPHADLARFLFGLDKALDRNAGPTVTIREQLREALLAGYAETGVCDPRAAPDRSLLAIYEGATLRGVARQRWGIGRRRDAIGFARRWLALVRLVRRELGRTA